MSVIDKFVAVVPRYAASLGGGAEALIRALLLDLYQSETPPNSIEVWTTCARDHRTWENYYPAGESVEDGITVKRFPVDARNLDRFITHELRMADGWPLTVDEQFDWLEQSVNSTALYEHIARHSDEVDWIVTGPYLFATTFWTGLIAPEKTLLVPCLHDERYAYLPVFQHLFEKVRGCIFNSQAEFALAKRLYPKLGLDQKSTVVGMSFVEPTPVTRPREKLAELNPELAHPFILYSGRKEQGKNLDLLITHFCEFSRQEPGIELRLALIGAGNIDFLETLPPGVIDLGFVDEDVKASLMQSAEFLCQPSTNESFSIVMMEAWLQNTPVVVHSDCDVTLEHVQTSGGGLYFGNAEEFCLVTKQLLSDRELRAKLGARGRDYVLSKYSKGAVLERLYQAMARVAIPDNPSAQVEQIRGRA